MSIIAMVTVAIGIFGLFAPSIPGMILIWAGIFLYAVITQFSKISTGFCCDHRNHRSPHYSRLPPTHLDSTASAPNRPRDYWRAYWRDVVRRN